MDIRLLPACGFYQLGQRKNQEDARYPDTDTPSPGQRYFIVCDGVGGLDKGEVASHTVAHSLGEYMSRVDLSVPFSADDFAYALGNAFERLDSVNRGDSLGMATTLTFIAFHAGGAFVAHIGDSRIYQLRPGVGVVYRSQDHSLVNAMVTSGNLTPEEAVNHPKSNIITRCMGGMTPEERSNATTFNITDIRPGDFFLLCSDGVLHHVDDAGLAALVDEDSAPEAKCARLAALSHDSTDNNTAFLIGVQSVDGVSVTDCPPALETTPEPEPPENDSDDAPVPETVIIKPRAGIMEVTAASQPQTVEKEQKTGFFGRLFGRS